MGKKKKEEVKVEEKKEFKNEVNNVEEKKVKKNKETKVEKNDKKVNTKEDKKEKKEEVKEIKKEAEVAVDKKEEKALQKKLKRANGEKIVVASIIIGALVIAFGLFGFYYYNTNAKTVAKFDGGSVSTSDFTVYYKTFAPMLEYYGYPASIIPEQIANKAGIDMIILKKAKEAGVTLSDEDRAKVDEIFADEEQVQQFVSQGINVGKMKELYYNDYTITAYIEKMKQEAKSEDVLAYIKEKAGEEADLYEYNTSHILFKTIDESENELSEADVANVRSKAEAALSRALAGEDFATLAKELSEDVTKENGGVYVMYMDGKTYTEYSDAVKTLQVGGITTTLVKSQVGYHIIKLNDKIENGRANNANEREEFVDEDINSLSETMNLEVDNEYLIKLVESITGEKIEEETTDTTTELETEESTTDESSTESTEGNNTTETTEVTE